MQSIKSIILLFIIVVTALTGDKAMGQVPDNRLVTYDIRKDPYDPDSNVIYSIVLDITAIEVDGNSVGWEVSDISIHKVNFLEQIISTRSEAYPLLNTTDGLWWIEHSDPLIPAIDEFVMPPLMSGNAVSSDPNVDDLNYDLEGVTYVEPLKGPLFVTTAALDYSLNSTSEVEDGDDEPVRMPQSPSDPY